MATQQDKPAKAEEQAAKAEEQANKEAAEQNKEQLKAAEERAKEAAPEGAEPEDYTGFSPAATDKIAAKTVDMERALPFAEKAPEDLSKGADDAEPAFKEE